MLSAMVSSQVTCAAYWFSFCAGLPWCIEAIKVLLYGES
ncbi:Uncharacterised protein [Vibrio cholerae]|nr:Uncharacterised protein [Vibrio cholerae]